MKMHSIASFMNRREVRLGAAFLCFMLSSTSLMAQQTTAATLAANLGAEGEAWIIWSLRIVGGMCAIGGLMQLIGGFTGHEEGYHKVVKVGGGILLMGGGVYILMHSDTLYATLHLDNLFNNI